MLPLVRNRGAGLRGCAQRRVWAWCRGRSQTGHSALRAGSDALGFFFEQINSVVFMKVNSASVNNLRLAGSFVTYGEPNVKTVRPLIPTAHQSPSLSF